MCHAARLPVPSRALFFLRFPFFFCLLTDYPRPLSERGVHIIARARARAMATSSFAGLVRDRAAMKFGLTLDNASGPLNFSVTTAKCEYRRPKLIS
jgi:hypothetical protein